MTVPGDENYLTFRIIIIRNWRLFENMGQCIYTCQIPTKFLSYLGVSFDFRMLDN